MSDDRDGSQRASEKSVLYGIDPGSAKAWACASAELANGQVRNCRMHSFPIRDLDQLVDEIAGHVSSGDSSAERPSVLLSVDAPINAPRSFDWSWTAKRMFPFDVSPFCQRPCEKALAAKPRAVPVAACRLLVECISTLCDWKVPHPHNDNVPFAGKGDGKKRPPGKHPGVSVQGYMEAPHGPVVTLFKAKLLERLTEKKVACLFSPREALKPQSGHVYFLESHPAVAMAFMASARLLGETPHIHKYKGSDGEQVRGDLIKEVRKYATLREFGDAMAELPFPSDSDDELDAYVSLLNLLDLLMGSGDWFGTELSGYFLVPKIPELSFAEVWSDAEKRLAGADVAPHGAEQQVVADTCHDPACSLHGCPVGVKRCYLCGWDKPDQTCWGGIDAHFHSCHQRPLETTFEAFKHTICREHWPR